MKKIVIMLFVGMLLLSACSSQNTTTEDSKSSLTDNSALNSNSVSSEASAHDLPLENGTQMQDDQVFAEFKELAEQGKSVLYWYYGDVDDGNQKGLEIDADGATQVEPYRKVGKFSTIAEMKESTNEVFTQKFCDTLFYDNAFVDKTGTDKPMYKEIDGALYRNANSGGFGWLYQLTDEYDIALQIEDLIVLTVKCNVADSESWYNCMMKKENGSWKLEKLYDYSPYVEYEKLAAPALSSPVAAAADWEKISDIEPTYLISYYIYQFCSDLDGDYNDATPYIVPASEVVENLSLYLDGTNKDMMIAAAKNEYSSMEYDEATDSFKFYITFDPASFIVCSTTENGDNVTLQTLIIGKSGRAVRWSYLTVQKTEDGLRYISNRVEEIPEN